MQNIYAVPPNCRSELELLSAKHIHPFIKHDPTINEDIYGQIHKTNKNVIRLVQPVNSSTM